MTAVQVVSSPLDDGRRRERVYGGGLLIFKDVPPLGELCSVTDGLVRAAFGGLEPVTAQFALDQADYVARVGSLQKRYGKHARVEQFFRAALEPVGVILQRTCHITDGTPLSALIRPEGSV